MSYSGEHPRLGALDVCPFIPVRGVSMEECVECAKEFAERLANEFGVPGILFCIFLIVVLTKIKRLQYN